MQQTTLQQEFIRDITSVVPMSKSEAKRRLDDILLQQRKEIVEWSKQLIAKHNARILNEFQNQGTADMPFIAYDERVCLIPAITLAMEETDEDIITKLSGYNIWENLMKNLLLLTGVI